MKVKILQVIFCVNIGFLVLGVVATARGVLYGAILILVGVVGAIQSRRDLSKCKQEV